MTSISALPASIVNWLNMQDIGENIKFLTEYPPQYKAVPLKKPIVSVGVNKITITDHFTANDDGVLERDEYCRTADIEIILSIHVPFSDGGEKCHELFTTVVDLLTFSSDLNITMSHCDNISSDRDTDALVMNAYINVQSDFCPAEESEDNFHSFLDKEFLCGTHVRDDQIHITQSEREKWNGKNLVNYFLGSGASERNVDIGFRPLFIVIFASAHFPVEYAAGSDKAHVYIAFGSEYYTTKGIELTNTGFRIYNNSKASTENGVLSLNEAGKTYCFYAVRPD
ncbi:MAG: hypothetical protein IJS17_02420 [Clostridia bacterium]|nr:hypothetical protein [Clostridia bacterium]